MCFSEVVGSPSVSLSLISLSPPSSNTPFITVVGLGSRDYLSRQVCTKAYVYGFTVSLWDAIKYFFGELSQHLQYPSLLSFYTLVYHSQVCQNTCQYLKQMASSFSVQGLYRWITHTVPRVIPVSPWRQMLQRTFMPNREQIWWLSMESSELDLRLLANSSSNMKTLPSCLNRFVFALTRNRLVTDNRYYGICSIVSFGRAQFNG